MFLLGTHSTRSLLALLPPRLCSRRPGEWKTFVRRSIFWREAVVVGDFVGKRRGEGGVVIVELVQGKVEFAISVCPDGDGRCALRRHAGRRPHQRQDAGEEFIGDVKIVLEQTHESIAEVLLVALPFLEDGLGINHRCLCLCCVVLVCPSINQSNFAVFARYFYDASPSRLSSEGMCVNDRF